MQQPFKQQGLSMPVFALIAAIGGFFLLCAFKVIPPYAENRYVIAALNSLAENPDELESMTPREIEAELKQFYAINNVRSEGPENIEVTRRSGKTLVDIRYETRVDLLMNVDLVLSFDNHLDSSRPALCCRPIKELSERL